MALCLCDRVVPLVGRTQVLVLQHPQEPDEVLGTAQILGAALSTVRVRTGLSWPNLAAAWGEPVTPGRWAVLWRGSLPAGAVPPSVPVVRLDASGRSLGGDHRWDGIVALDGTWSQGKTLWWRNPWLTKLDRIVLQPTEAGIYGRVRREPDRHAVSTLEAVSDAIVANGDDPDVRRQLRAWMRTLVQRARDTDPRNPKRNVLAPPSGD
jgi:DTW domain-containing protein YfiP